MEMEDNHERQGSPAAGEGEGLASVEILYDATVAESAADSVDQIDPVSPSNRSALDSFQSLPKDTRPAEDGVREDTFVDCPDEIEPSESQQNSEEKDDLQDDQADESDSGIKVPEMIAEIELLRDKLEKSVFEKEQLAQEYEGERAVLLRELSQFCHQLKVLNEQHLAADDNVDGFINHHQNEVVTWDATVGSGASLHEIISECSRLLEVSTNKRQQTEEKVNELHSVLYSKDQEIDFLNAKVADLTESSNLAWSDANSKHDDMSRLYEARLETDRHIEETANRILSSLTMVDYQDELWNRSLIEKIYSIEKSVTFVVEKYNTLVSGSDQLKGCLNEVGSDFNRIDEIGTFALAHDKILELKRKEEDMYQNLSNLEVENRNLVEQLEKQNLALENVNAEIRRLSAEVDQEKNRYANTKEKLSMAVTKGKALVQQRDSLRQLLQEKTSELDRCSIELQEKSTALEAAEREKEMVASTEKFAASLQESLAEKEMVLQKCGEILSESLETKELQPTDIAEMIRWLADENKSLKDISLQYRKLTDALSSFDFPEAVASSELDVRVHWLAESCYVFKEEAMKLQHEIAKAVEAANGKIEHLTTSLLAEIQEKNDLQTELEVLRSNHEAHERSQNELAETRQAENNEIDRLTSSLLAESQEKSHLQLELENMRQKYEEVVEKEYQVSLEKDKIVGILLEASGLANDGHREVHLESSYTSSIVDSCVAKIRENACANEPSLVKTESFESFASLLYVRDLEMTLYKQLTEEGILDRAQVFHLSEELKMKTLELNSLKDEKAVMQKSLDQLEDRCALVKEKLSMAVKKGKGLVQERENLKGSINEKNAEIENLKAELQQYVTKYAECQDQISKLLVDVERISLLERDLVSTKEQKDQLEQFLAESNSMLQRVMESIEGISTPTDLFVNDSIEKVKWLAGYLSECEISKAQMEQELRTVNDEASSLASKLSEVQTVMKSLEDSLSVIEKNRSELLDEKKELEVSKALMEEELQKEKNQAYSHTSKYEELFMSTKALEDALSIAEENVSRVTNERDAAIEGKPLAEERLNKLNEELSDHVKKLGDADKIIQSLEDALSQAQKNASLLAEENSKVQTGQADLDGEIKRISEEADLLASKLSESFVTIQSLEGELLNSQNNMADLVQEKRNAEEEINSLTSQLKSCMEELAGNRSSIQSRTLELSGQLDSLQLLLKDETLSTLLGQCFQRKFESLKNIDFILKEIWDCSLEMDSDMQQNSLIMKDDSSISTTFPSNTDIAPNLEILNDEGNAIDGESMSDIEKMVKRYHLRSKILADNFGKLSTLFDESMDALLRGLQLRKDKIVNAMKYTCSLKDQVKDIEMDKKRQEDTIASLERDIKILLSACTDATQGLDLNVNEVVSKLRSINELVNLDGRRSMDMEAVNDDQEIALATDHVKKAHELLLAARRNQDLGILFQDAISKLTNMTENMQNKLKATQLTSDEILEERDLYKDKILKLETDLKEQQNLHHEITIELEDMRSKLKEMQVTCDEALEERDLYKEKILKSETDLKAQQDEINEMAIKLEDQRKKENELRKREAELSTSFSKFRELEETLSASQVKSILDKIKLVDVPDAAFAFGDSDNSANVRKLFYVLDSFSGYMDQVSSLSHQNGELHSTIDKQVLDMEQLKRQVEDYVANEKNSEKLNKLLELESGLQLIAKKLGGGDVMDDSKVNGGLWLLPLLEKLVAAVMHESETLKLKNEDLGAKLLGAQKAVDDLSNKVKLLEESNQAREIVGEIDQERGTSLASLSTQTEISEMQDVATLPKSNNIPSVSSAAHVRTLRKGSSDHLAINIESETERFINDKGSDEDKGHAFKPLVTSGMIPRQGRTLADRVDGIWVNGSRALMSHPRGRLGVIAYWLVLHIWLVATFL
ncbi:LOW QUALITY PROTEIN: trans-Golgi network-localized SYP41-interacting protein 1 [Salvia miltiorrhiza]|uniref:LOW QUALITY PROTEIN: trans-Golgi network-localized SYP41-interacting protein 1 n=1 Tax=Salvia miltiorrhiza TaxID=226208 RepID=UPI0025AC62B2|nr:LOW QUALITY PROTEIN: trans-Golgi network-localized SYP41-interacting protein 1 [Salvia miltiorrhiza]